MAGIADWLRIGQSRGEVAEPAITMSRATVNCKDEDWRERVHGYLYREVEVDLMNFDYDLHGTSCELLAQAFSVEFILDRDPANNRAHFRKRPSAHHRGG